MDFHRRHYAADNMTLTVVGRESLDALQASVEEKFAGVRARGQEAPAATAGDYSPALAADSASVSAAATATATAEASAAIPAFDAAHVGHLYRVVPVADLRSLRIFWPLPPVRAHYRAQPTRVLSHQLGHEAAGSLLALLKRRDWAVALSAGVDYSTDSFAAFVCTVQLTEAGLERARDVAAAVFRYLALMRAQDDAALSAAHAELAAIAATNFRFKGVEAPQSYATALARNLHEYAPEHALSGEQLLSASEARPDLTRALLRRLAADNCNVFVVSKTFAGRAGSQTERWFGTEHTKEAIPAAWLEAMRGGNDNDAAVANADADAEMRLPAPNPFVATDFSLVAPRPAAAAPASASDQSASLSSSRSNESDDVSSLPSADTLAALVEEAPLYSAVLAPKDESLLSSSPPLPSKQVAVSAGAALFSAPAKILDSPALTVWWKPDTRYFKVRAHTINEQ
jgi:insulysin